MKQETFPFWHFLVRGAAAIGWTAMCILAYLAMPHVLTGIVAAVFWVRGQYLLIKIFDFIFVDMEDGTDE